ncbi:MAG: hypothetical protein Q9157_004750 [Trypethelium eluteriae]
MASVAKAPSIDIAGPTPKFVNEKVDTLLKDDIETSSDECCGNDWYHPVDTFVATSPTKPKQSHGETYSANNHRLKTCLRNWLAPISVHNPAVPWLVPEIDDHCKENAHEKAQKGAGQVLRYDALKIELDVFVRIVPCRVSGLFPQALRFLFEENWSVDFGHAQQGQCKYRKYPDCDDVLSPTPAKLGIDYNGAADHRTNLVMNRLAIDEE